MLGLQSTHNSTIVSLSRGRMALINCPDCNGQVSDKATACPHCGLPSRYFVASLKQANKNVSPQFVDDPSRPLGSFHGNNLYKGSLCPLCNVGTICLEGQSIRCSNPKCEWSQEILNDRATKETIKRKLENICPSCGSEKLEILSRSPYIVRCSNPKCTNH